MITPIKQYGHVYLVLDMHNLFVSTTMDDEILIFNGSDTLKKNLASTARDFKINWSGQRPLSSYSGGEQAILGCLLVMHLAPKKPLKILLVHILETLSEQNRKNLLTKFASILPTAKIFTLGSNGPQPINHA